MKLAETAAWVMLACWLSVLGAGVFVLLSILKDLS
jgi:hypothetical protein